MSFPALNFDNSFVHSLPGDPIEENYLRQVSGVCYSYTQPTPVSKPSLVCFSKELAQELGFTEEDCLSSFFLNVFSGNEVLPGIKPYAMCYGGHQFGNWAGQLGDGRAITLGEIVLKNGEKRALQLKGAGSTPYSRSADGLAVLRSSLREYVCSEAMYYLGVPTTRALSLVLTGKEVIRDMLYDGHPAAEPGAIVCRVAPSFMRFGNFEICTARSEFDLLKQLADYTINEHFPHLLSEPEPSRYISWFNEVVQRTVRMIVEWMRVGFVHGVMNTDNMSILGLTIDYGPYGWLEDFDPNWTPNTTDASTRRYRYGQQPAVAHWNLIQLANAVVPLIGETKPLEDVLRQFPDTYRTAWVRAIQQKLGLRSLDNSGELLTKMEQALLATETDLTLFYRYLASLDIVKTVDLINPLEQIKGCFYGPDDIKRETANLVNSWLRNYAALVKQENRPHEERINEMNSVNPLYVPRNYLAQLAIDRAEEGDDTYLKDWLEVLKKPYESQPGKEAFAAKRPEWARTRVGCSMLSCSS